MSDANNPYQTPEAAVADAEMPKVEIPLGILNKIKGGWIAALVSGTFTLIFTLAATFGNDITGFIGPEMFIDVVLIFSLAFGIYKKSRIAATVMFVYFVISKIYIWAVTGQFSGTILAVIFLYFYFQAMVGTFQYHKLLNNRESK